ncbi:MAG: DnaJ domain-containing protein [Alphaproteobacteria bacterium]|nr:DnaJ domain-containing protein [Alphaproteobacteria bacterium]
MARTKNDIPVSKTRVDEPSGRPDRVCDFAACAEAGDHRAPKSKLNLDEYYWFCLEHVAAYNRSWDYFTGMDQDAIEKFRDEAVTGHRPTWKLGERGYKAWIEGRVRDHHDLFEDLGSQTKAGKPKLRPTRRQRQDLAQLDLDETATLQDIKMRYKQLVKRFHPDANGGDKQAEERFKSINEAYTNLKSSGLP